jgi:xylulokinase
VTEKLLVGVDVGTYSTKGVLTTPDGRVLAQHVIEHGLDIPRPGWAQHDPEKIWWGEFTDVVQTLFRDSGYTGRDVAAVAVSAIGPCLVPVGADGKAIGPGILYGVDTRSVDEIRDLETLYGADEMYRIGGSRLSSQAVGPKILWLRRNQPEAYDAARFFHSASDYIVLRLTGEHVMDAYTASLYNPLFDLGTGGWTDRFAEEIVEIDRLPPVRWSSEVAGEVTAEAGRETGLISGTPVTVGTVDAVAEAVSVGAVNPGDLMCMYGSSVFFILAAKRPYPEPAMWAVCHAFNGLYGVAAGMATGGSLTRWFRDQLARDLSGDDAYETLAAEASGAPLGSLGLVVLPYFSGERTPINDPLARGVICGLSLAHSRGHLYRAVIEGASYGIAHNLNALRAAGAGVRRIVAVGGGAKNRLWLQIVSDVSGLGQEITEQGIGASYGDAFLAGHACGIIPSLDDLHHSWVSVVDRVEPDEAAGADYRQYFDLYRRLYLDSADVQHELALAVSGDG